MLSYPEWTEAVHDAYKSNGGVYEGRGTAQELTKYASEWWESNKGQIQRMSQAEAERAAGSMLEKVA